MEDEEREEFRIRELDVDIISPTIKTMFDKDVGGHKTIILGRPGTGKNWLIKDLMEQKKHIFPCGMFFGGNEAMNMFFHKYCGDAFTYNELDTTQIKRFKNRQQHARKNLKNPWAMLVIDDCTDNVKILKDPIMQAAFKKGRWWKMWLIMTFQVNVDLPKYIRTCADGIFIMRNPNVVEREHIYRNFAGIIPSLAIFCQIMDEITEDYTALYIDARNQSNDWKDCVYYYKAVRVSDKAKFGCEDVWQFQHDRLVDNFDPRE